MYFQVSHCKVRNSFIYLFIYFHFRNQLALIYQSCLEMCVNLSAGVMVQKDCEYAIVNMRFMKISYMANPSVQISES